MLISVAISLATISLQHHVYMVCNNLKPAKCIPLFYVSHLR